MCPHNSMRTVFIKTLSTFFGVGYLPLIPGTFGSVAGLCVYALIKQNAWIYGTVTLALIIIGLLTATETERLFHQKDPRCVVIDEVSGMLVSLIWIPYTFEGVIIAFFLFRLLDTLKPFPAARLEQRRGGIGIMADDLIAGIYTNILLQVIIRFASLRTS